MDPFNYGDPMGVPPQADPTVMVKQLRQARKAHPYVDMAASMVPGVGAAQGLDTLTNPESSGLDRLLTGASLIPGGRVASTGIKGVGGKVSYMLNKLRAKKQQSKGTVVSQLQNALDEDRLTIDLLGGPSTKSLIKDMTKDVRSEADYKRIKDLLGME